MDELVEALAFGNVTAVKLVLASVVTAFAIYQALLMAVGYGKLRLPFLRPRAASWSHRAIGDTTASLTVFVALLCVGYFGLENDDVRVTLHVFSAVLLLAVLAFKITVVRRWHRLGRYLPLLGSLVLALFVLTWLTSAGSFLLNV